MKLPQDAGAAWAPAHPDPQGCSSRAQDIHSVAVLLHDTRSAPDARAALSQLAKEVERLLPRGWHVLASEPSEQAVTRLVSMIAQAGGQAAGGPERLVVVPTRPHFAAGCTGKALATLYSILARSAPHMQLEVRPSWADDAAYVQGLAEQIGAAAQVGSARGALDTPQAVLVTDDEHPDTAEPLRRTAVLVAEQLGWSPQQVQLHRGVQGLTNLSGSVIACPADLAAAERGSAAHPTWCDPVGTRQQLIKALSMVVRRGRHALAPGAVPCKGRVAAAPVRHLPALTKGLFMVGASIPGAVPEPTVATATTAGLAPCCTPEQFLGIKRPHLETLDLLQALRQEPSLSEFFIFNTCQRFELYGWLDESAGVEPEMLLERLAGVIGRQHRSALVSAHGRQAWYHLLRTTAGLNSGLIGDGDVVEQLESALRTAGHAGTAGPRCTGLVDRAAASTHELRAGTPWGRYTHRYAHAAVSNLPAEVQSILRQGTIAIIGGSTTSVSLVETLREHYGVPASRMVLFYRGERRGALMNRLLRALGDERLEQVDSYTDDKVVRAVAGADVAFLASDHRGAVLHADQLRAARASSAAPLVLVDFNSFGSIGGLGEETMGATAQGHAPGLPSLRVFDAGTIARIIDDFNRATLADPAFVPALEHAEHWLREQAHEQRECPAVQPAEAAA